MNFTLPASNSLPLKIDGWNTSFLGPGLFAGRVSPFSSADDVASHLFFVEGGILPSWAPKRLRGDRDGWIHLCLQRKQINVSACIYLDNSIYIWDMIWPLFFGTDQKIKGVYDWIWFISFFPPEKIQQNNVGPPCWWGSWARSWPSWMLPHVRPFRTQLVINLWGPFRVVGLGKVLGIWEYDWPCGFVGN